MPFRRMLFLLALVGATGELAGCKAAVQPEVEFPQAPPKIGTLDDFEAGFNRLALLEQDDPGRAALRDRLLAYLLRYIDRHLTHDAGEAQSAIKYAVTLYTPQDLKTAPPHPGLAKRAQALYRIAGRRGQEEPALLALAIQQRFGTDEVRDHALEEWAMLETWAIENGPYAADPLLRHEELEDALEEVAAVFPSPFVTQRLVDLYVARYRVAKQMRAQGRTGDASASRRMEITGYLILRAHLRADDIEAAAAESQRVELDPPVAKLRTMMLDATHPRRSALPLLALAEQFAPEPDADASQPFVIQGWGIVDNLSRRAVARFPQDPFVHLLRARALQAGGLVDAAIVALRRALELKEDHFEAWQTLAQLEHEKLERLSDADPSAAEKHLVAVEAMHRRAIELWADRPLDARLSEAFYVVAQGLYQAGEVARAERLLERSLEIEPIPNTIDLLGTIALKRSELPQARKRFEDLVHMAYEDELSQLQWAARAQFQLGEIATRQGNAGDASRHIRAALRHTNDLLARTNTNSPVRSNRYVDRGTLLFLLGDVDLAMDDFRRAAELDPSSIKAYADPLKFVVAYGYHDEARSIFRRSMAQEGLPEGLKLYFCLWMLELAKRQGLPAEPEAERFIAEYKGSTWGTLLAGHALGKISFEELLPRATGRGERAEAYFYEGLRRWGAGDPAAGKSFMREVLKTGMMGFLEYDMAQSYLEWGELPRMARSPVAALRRHSSADERPTPSP